MQRDIRKKTQVESDAVKNRTANLNIYNEIRHEETLTDILGNILEFIEIL